MRPTLIVLAAAAVGLGCKARELEAPANGLAATCPTWKDDVASLMSSRCASCHGGADPAGGYDVTSYLGAIDRSALDQLATVLAAGTADEAHAPVADTLPVLTQWVQQCRLAYVVSAIHGPGILDPENATEFHGAVLASSGFKLDACAKCHGDDYSGGAAGVACTTCHQGGPTACTTCHGQPPATGSHLPHTTRGIACSQCHDVPATWDAPGHLENPKAVDCSPCHGGQLADPAASNTNPTWGGGPDQAACGTCHGIPPANHHNNAACVTCHQVAIDADMVPNANHVNGVVDLGDGKGDCMTCHRHPGGAHDAHLTGMRLRAPLSCDDCHVVPTDVNSPGHIDHDPPATVTFGAAARADSAAPSYDYANQTCSGTECHGGGHSLANDAAPSRLTAVSWLAGAEQATCGTCHGAPPKDFHRQDLEITDCVQCHAATVDGFGNILVHDGQSAHMNGQIDVQ